MPADISAYWHARAIILMIVLASAWTGFGQTAAEETVTRILRFAHISDPQFLVEATTVIRSIGEIRQVNLEASSRTLTLRGSTAQIALAEWLFNELDRPSTTQHPNIREFQMPGTPEGVVRIFYPANTQTIESLQELTVAIRSIAEIRRAFTFNPAKAMVLRGTSDELAMAEWLFYKLDQTAEIQSAPQEYRGPGVGENVVRVFFLKPSFTLPEFQQKAVQIRTITKIRRLFTYNGPRAVALRGTAAQIAEAERLIKEHRL